MAVNSISSNRAVPQPAQKPAPAAQERQLQKNVDEASKTRDEGNRAAAKNAEAAPRQSVQQASPVQAAGSNTQNVIRTAVKGVGEALKTGSATDAKHAFAAVQQAQQQKIDQRNSERTRQSVSAEIGLPTADAAVGRNVGRHIDTKA